MDIGAADEADVGTPCNASLIGSTVDETVFSASNGPIVAILGPTAIGKSALALQLCEEFDGVVLSADSRQVYRYMDIGTAKATPSERARVPHFMVDLVEPSDVYTGQRFAEEGQRVLTAQARLNRPVFVVGGTGFYVSLLLDRTHLPPVAPDDALRAALRAQEELAGPGTLHTMLVDRDPEAAQRIHPHNLPRILRALEINELTGRPVPALPPTHSMPALYLGLNMDRSLLYDIADARVHQQFANGLLEETEILLAMGYSPNSPALDGLGYRQMVQYLQGVASREAAVEGYKVATRRYIRRQLTWFRRDHRIEWLDWEPPRYSIARERVGRHLARV